MRHMGADRVREAHLETLTADFSRLKIKDTDSIDSFAGRILELSTKSAALGEIIEESKMVKKFLHSFPRKKYIYTTTLLEQVPDLNKTSFDDIVGRLKAYEERITEEDEEKHEDQSQSKLMYANNDTQQYQERNESARGRGRGGRFGYRGRGIGRYGYQQYGNDFQQNGGYQQKNGYRQERDTSKVICFRCDKAGHYAYMCPDRLLKLQETQENEESNTQEGDELMVHEVVYLNEKNIMPSQLINSQVGDNVCYLDNGASNHMTGNLGYFSNLDKRITGKVRFGDDLRIDISRKGSIRFLTKNDDVKILSDVYYIPDLRSNIIFLYQATEAGCEVGMREEYLKLYDKDKKLIVKARRSKIRLYKVIM